MRKDYFYYCLRQRLDSSQEYAIKCATQLKYIEVYNKADGEFSIKFIKILQNINDEIKP